ncbi:CLUMA_CG015663, isoform A [Clunio marinus]|uniref:CLUMA_CG015663, isoform A n=1 Tax=Clunio marinus TaxID=568069 RepID=A0A1J1IRE1_9DIPT|nr:CLUMA_CG015663, isoform A [Clunio marinus]
MIQYKYVRNGKANGKEILQNILLSVGWLHIKNDFMQMNLFKFLEKLNDSVQICEVNVRVRRLSSALGNNEFNHKP